MKVLVSRTVGWLGAVALAVCLLASPATAASIPWKVQPTPNQNTAVAAIDELSAVSCTSAAACTAVGSHTASLSSPSFTLAERWNGTRWRIQPTILPAGSESASLSGVSCPSATACTAVGSAFVKATHRSVNLAETWNGTSWRVQAIPTPKASTNGALVAISCTSRRACTAVGQYNTATGSVLADAERWNGRTWRVQSPLQPTKITSFSGVSCSARLSCTAVGYFTRAGNARPLVETWNGAGWRRRVVPLPQGSPGGIFSAVSCTSPRACTATGGNFQTTGPTLAERWNGTRWRIQPTPALPNVATTQQQPQFSAVSCASATACAASGAYAPDGHPAYYVESWNGGRWRLQPAPHPAGFLGGSLNGMSCTGAGCTAVGGWTGGRISVSTLAIAN